VLETSIPPGTEVNHYLGELGGNYGKSARRKTFLGNIKQRIYSPKIGLTSSTRPAIDLDFGQISAGSGTSLNCDKVRSRLCPLTNNASDSNDRVYTIVTSKRGQPASHAHLQLYSSWLVDKVNVRLVQDCTKTN
jgi:hypothetical protein